MTRYGIIDGANTVVKIKIEPNYAAVHLWNGKNWTPAPTEYSGIFVGEIQINEIEEGDAIWVSRHLHE